MKQNIIKSRHCEEQRDEAIQANYGLPRQLRLLAMTLLVLAFSAPAFAQSAEFCNEVNAKREFCKTARVDCSTLMNGDLDAKTLDTLDLIKGCAPAKPTQPVSTPPKHPEIGNYPCCMSQSR